MECRGSARGGQACCARLPVPDARLQPNARSEDESPSRHLATSPRRPLRRHRWHSSRGTRLPLDRSEEHTSELQSHHDIVCRLLLEKKKHTKLYPSRGHSIGRVTFRYSPLSRFPETRASTTMPAGSLRPCSSSILVSGPANYQQFRA